MSSLVRLRALVALTVAAGLLAAGCGETVIDDVKTEQAIEQNLQDSLGRNVAAVDCPSGVEVESGATFDCAVSLAGGKQETATLKILNEDADVEVTNLKPDKQAGKG
jgi:NAD(P)H-hydrate repair Nnr-like enzyme with NAD(P)H-hydrate epimerase domain